MSGAVEWLPPLVLLQDSNGDWLRYVEAIYDIFKSDFIRSTPLFRSKNVGIRFDPVEKGKAATFWHIISEGAVEEERIPDLRRCERIRWPRKIIDNSDKPEIKIWEAKKKGERVYLLLQSGNENYLVVLRKGKTYFLLLTAFMVERKHQVEKLVREYWEYKKMGSPI